MPIICTCSVSVSSRENFAVAEVANKFIFCYLSHIKILLVISKQHYMYFQMNLFIQLQIKQLLNGFSYILKSSGNFCLLIATALYQ